MNIKNFFLNKKESEKTEDETGDTIGDYISEDELRFLLTPEQMEVLYCFFNNFQN